MTIAGERFGSAQGASQVTFNGALATVSSWSDGAIVAEVPMTALTGPVVVTVQGLESNALLFRLGAAGEEAGPRVVRACSSPPSLCLGRSILTG